MTQPKIRKTILWILIDLLTMLLFLAGGFQLLQLEIPYISDLARPFPAFMLIALGIGISILSSILFILRVKKAKNNNSEASNTDTGTPSAVERSKR